MPKPLIYFERSDGMIKASEAMVKSLEIEGIKVIFGYPGAAICPFYDSLAKVMSVTFLLDMNRMQVMPLMDTQE